jgi:hypothetical protein
MLSSLLSSLSSLSLSLSCHALVVVAPGTVGIIGHDPGVGGGGGGVRWVDIIVNFYRIDVSRTKEKEREK